MSFNKQEKQESIGSLYFNFPQKLDESVKKKCAGAVNFLRENGAYLSLSLKSGKLATITGDYARLTGFQNGFKKGPKDPDYYMIEKTDEKKTGKPSAAKKEVQNEEESVW